MAATDLGVDVGTLPNQWTYAFKKMGEGIGMVFAFGEQTKAQLKYTYALRRLAESEELAEIGEYQYTQMLMNEYRNNIQEAEQHMIRAQQAGQDMTQLALQIQTNLQNQEQILQRLRQHAPEEALQGVNDAIQVTQQNRERIREHWEEAIQQQEQSQEQQQSQSGNQSQQGQ